MAIPAGKGIPKAMFRVWEGLLSAVFARGAQAQVDGGRYGVVGYEALYGTEGAV